MKNIISGKFLIGYPERNGAPKANNHQLFVLRLRDEITASASLHLVQYVSEVNQKVNAELQGILDQIIPSLQNISKKRIYLDILLLAIHHHNHLFPLGYKFSLMSQPKTISK